jgi:hypothetical protein
MSYPFKYYPNINFEPLPCLGETDAIFIHREGVDVNREKYDFQKIPYRVWLRQNGFIRW